MKRVVIESPLAGDLKRNQRYARLCLIDCFRRGEAGFASHLLYTQVLDDTHAPSRKLGIAAGLHWGCAAELRAVYTDLGVSEGMQLGIDTAKLDKQAIEYRALALDLMAMLDTDESLPATDGAADTMADELSPE